jgi:ribosomal protein L23
MKGKSSFALKRPRFTEKATLATDAHVYTFVVEKSATKEEIASHVAEKFGKTPLKVRTSNLPSKERRRGVKPGVKKAYVYLKKGDTIDFV